MAKICFYCGKEINDGKRCTCRTSGSSMNDSKKSGANSDSREKSKESRDDFIKKEKERREKRRERKKSKKAKGSNGFSNSGYQAYNKSRPGGKMSLIDFFYRLMTNARFSKSDPLKRKLGYSLIQTIFRPVSAADAFVYNKDSTLTYIYLSIFCIFSGLLSARILGTGITAFFEGFLFGGLFALMLNAFFMVALRVFLKIRYLFNDLLSSFCVSAIYMSVFFLIASIGRITPVSFLAVLIPGLIAGALMHYISVKTFTGFDDGRLATISIMVYFVFFTALGFILNLMLPLPTITG